MSIVYVLGAGASFGDRLIAPENCPAPVKEVTATPPLIHGFFAHELLENFKYAGKTAEADFPDAIRYIRWMKRLADPVGEGEWNQLNIEEVFTSIELDREFRNPESDEGAKLLLIRNQLIRYIGRILGSSTHYKHGEYIRLLCNSLRPEDSIVTFNWDLLVDQELHPRRAMSGTQQKGGTHYRNFFLDGLGIRLDPNSTDILAGQGMLLKVHGSLNWFQCGNLKCPGHSQLFFDHDVEYCLRRAMGIHFGGEDCKRCGSETVPLLVPPLLRKPISDNWIIRAAWGHARSRLLSADGAVIIGFSGAGTDFYATWLLRSTLGLRDNVEILVVDPANDPAHSDHAEFSSRMRNIFPSGYNSEFLTVSQIDSVLKRVVPAT